MLTTSFWVDGFVEKISLYEIFPIASLTSESLNPIKHGVRQVPISRGGVQSARSLLGLSRDLIRPFVGHHKPLYSVGVYYGAPRKKIFKKSRKRSSFHNFCLMIQFSEKIKKFEFSNLKLA